MARLRRLPPMNALKAFDAAARCKGFTAAAQELSVSAGAISRHVANLEDYLGVGLFERHHNEISLTPAGEQYFARVRSALHVIEDASQLLLESNNPREVHITALPTFALRWLIPRLPRFTAAHPGVAIQLSTSVAQIQELDLALDGIDIALHFSISELASNHCDFLFETELQVVCAPRIAATIRKPADVAQQILLYTANGITQWRQWLQSVGLDISLAKRGMVFGNSSLALQAAVDGVGISLGETIYVQDDIKAGRLVSPLEARLYTNNRYYMSVNSARAEMPGVRAFRHWLLSDLHAQQVEQGRSALVTPA